MILTSDTKWISSCLDSEPDYETYFDAISDLKNLDRALPFDDYGEYIDDPEIAVLCHQWYSCFDLSSMELPDPPDIVDSALEARETQEKPVDYLEYQPQLGWLKLETIRQTFKHTTKYYKRAYSTLLRKTYSSPYPACNVPRRNEPIATDTVFSDTPAIDNGARMAQIYVGTKSLVADCYGIKTQKAFINSLLDIIRDRGAPTKLVSDRAQVEISNKAKDILSGGKPRLVKVSKERSRPCPGALNKKVKSKKIQFK